MRHDLPTPPAASAAQESVSLDSRTFRALIEPAPTGDAKFARIFSIRLEADGAARLQDDLTAIHPDDAPRINERIVHSLATGADYECDYRIRRGDGFRWVTGRGRMTRDAQGRVVQFSGVVLQITDRKRAEEERRLAREALQRQFRIYDTILSATDDFACIFDRP
jgi:PAS domain-containing protein